MGRTMFGEMKRKQRIGQQDGQCDVRKTRKDGFKMVEVVR